MKGDGSLVGEGGGSSISAGDVGTHWDLALTISFYFLLRPACFSFFMGISSSSFSLFKEEDQGGGTAFAVSAVVVLVGLFAVEGLISAVSADVSSVVVGLFIVSVDSAVVGGGIFIAAATFFA